MQIDLAAFLTAASGPFGGPANRLKLTTTKHGKILVTPRKVGMTGDLVHPLHAWSRLHWIAADVLWKALPQRVRAEWGKCTRRTADTVKSNLDEFRAVNLPRMILGFPSLRLPPNRFKSVATYLQRAGPDNPGIRRKPMQVWLHGEMKPEPPEPGGDPIPPKQFSAFEASDPNSLIASVDCAYQPCPDDTNPCFDQLYCYMPVEFEVLPPQSYLEWHCITEGEPPTRQLRWLPIRRIESKRIWYDSRPYEEIWASDIRCRSGQWGDLTIPWPGAWTMTLTYDCAPAVKRSDGFFWKPLTDLCPHGPWQLAGYYDYYEHYPWQEIIELPPGGTTLADPPPCTKPDTFIFGGIRHASMWSDLSDANMWAGVSWYTQDYKTLHYVSEFSGGPAFANATDVRCCDTGPRAGNWWFLMTVTHNGEPYTLEFRKPAAEPEPHWSGHYQHYDPDNSCPWASPFMLIAEGEVDWPDKVITPMEVIAWECLKFLAAELLGMAAVHLLGRARRYVGKWAPYAPQAISNAARAARPVHAAGSISAYKCTYRIQIARGGRTDAQLAREVWRRIRLRRLPLKIP